MTEFSCEGGCGASWISPNHTRCEGCGNIRNPYSIGVHRGWLVATAAAEAKHERVVEAATTLLQRGDAGDGGTYEAAQALRRALAGEGDDD